MATTPNAPANAGTTHPQNKKKNYTPLAFVVGFVFLVFVAPRFISFKDKDDDSEKSAIIENWKNKLQSYPTKTTPHIEKTSYPISKEWTLVNIPYGVERIRFRDASVKYCAKNAVEEHCSNGTEDISGLFGNEKDVKNLQFWIKTKEGEGEITVELQYY